MQHEYFVLAPISPHLQPLNYSPYVARDVTMEKGDWFQAWSPAETSHGLKWIPKTMSMKDWRFIACRSRGHASAIVSYFKQIKKVADDYKAADDNQTLAEASAKMLELSKSLAEELDFVNMLQGSE